MTRGRFVAEEGNCLIYIMNFDQIFAILTSEIVMYGMDLNTRVFYESIMNLLWFLLT